MGGSQYSGNNVIYLAASTRSACVSIVMMDLNILLVLEMHVAVGYGWSTRDIMLNPKSLQHASEAAINTYRAL